MVLLRRTDEFLSTNESSHLFRLPLAVAQVAQAFVHHQLVVVNTSDCFMATGFSGCTAKWSFSKWISHFLSVFVKYFVS